MGSKIDLRTASREALLAVIAGQQAVIEQLQRRVAALEGGLKGKGRPGMPGNKPGAKSEPAEKQEPRKPRPHGFSRPRTEPSHRIEHALDACPECGTGLVGGWPQRTREVIEIPVAPVEVTEHVFVTRVCPVCERRRTPKADLGGRVMGRGRLGANLVSLIVALREEGRLPIRTTKWYLETVHQLRLSVGGIIRVLHGVARQAQQAVGEVLELVRTSQVVHADETGWRQEGINGYVWTFSTPTERYFLRRGRNKEVVDEALGDSFQGVLVSDFYAAYNHYPGLKQRCWAHLLRDIHDLKAFYPADAKLARWAAAVHNLYAQAKRFSHPQAGQRRQAQLELERKLLARCRPFLDDPWAVQGKLCRRIQRFIKELFVFVAEPDVPSENNAAERSLRHLVTSRKISGGTRSPQGTDTKMALASLFGTWRARGLNPLTACHQLLLSPQL